ncbi:hypothetical protein [Oceanicoccus sp. KOV_DT_Chl]|uniref:hypothetical protein n=1 Tax=Oceanicoccus sp. KOV_DT_Chl TaxID=1904639 RepID=UPI001F31833B|nr:hypothetical protein [Oceanicoccus sp. KOV_DT_Chl]
MVIIISLGPYSNAAMFAPDQGSFWYYWKLQNPDFWSRFSVWSLYALHQISLWGLIAYAQLQRPKYSKTLNPVNIAAIAVNALFILLHIWQTKYWYDGLAQDTPVWTSQASVVFMLIFVLIMENKRRGLFFGKSIEAVEKPAGFLKRYHGYYFAWAIIYTFWFHPIEDTVGHLLGTFYTIMLMLQGSLFFTRFHTNRHWTLLLETFVLIHGALMAYMTAESGQWRMFLFGFLTMFVITQMHGIGLGNKTRCSIVGLYIAAIVFSYFGDWGAMIAIVRIPVAEYGLLFIIVAIAWLPVLLGRLVRARNKLYITKPGRVSKSY